MAEPNNPAFPKSPPNGQVIAPSPVPIREAVPVDMAHDNEVFGNPRNFPFLWKRAAPGEAAPATIANPERTFPATPVTPAPAKKPAPRPAAPTTASDPEDNNQRLA